MKIRLMNSAMMPVEGKYTLYQTTQDQFVNDLRFAAKNGKLESYIGYPDTALFIERISNVTIHVNREKTIVNDGDTLLICKLKYRVVDPNEKGKFTPTDDDYEFFICFYAK